jgi:hypothetical protein
MKEALQSAFILFVWVAFWLAGTLSGAVLQARLIDLGGFVRYSSSVCGNRQKTRAYRERQRWAL